ncbi:MAG: hypothetical protein M1435_03240 [Actinobacteria bacterium]|nr:hypothetical protein [Actinomycetota bacterium]
MDAKVILCDFAEVAGGKMFISGAGLALLASGTPTPPYRVNVALAIMGLIGLNDTDAQHKMTLELVYMAPDGEETRVPLADEVPEGGDPADKGMFIAYFVAPRSPEMLPSDEWAMPMAIPMYGLGLPALGSYYFSVRIDGREMDRSSFRLVMPQPPDAVAPPGAPGSGEQSAGGPGGRQIADGPSL